MIKNYKACRQGAEVACKLIILKNNQPDAVLFSIYEYEKLSVFIEFMENVGEKDILKALTSLSKTGNKRTYTIDYHIHEKQLIIAIDELW